jgi:hypothetical protein
MMRLLPTQQEDQEVELLIQDYHVLQFSDQVMLCHDQKSNSKEFVYEVKAVIQDTIAAESFK